MIYDLSNPEHWPTNVLFDHNTQQFFYSLDEVAELYRTKKTQPVLCFCKPFVQNGSVTRWVPMPEQKLVL